MMSRFLEISKGIVEDFLQTAVFLDDRAFFPNENGTNGIAFSSTTEIEDPVTGEITTIPTPQVSEQNEHDLNAKTIIDTFMQKGIVCSVIKCEESTFDAQRSNYLKLMKKADIIVLDWDLFRDGGEKIVGIIKDLMSADEELHELRSIVIYTANDLETVKGRLEREELTFEDYISHNKRYTTISLWNKNSSGILSDRKANFTEVVDKCIDEFTETFHGIVPNVAMAAIAEVRKNTHKLLGVLNQGLDPAYLSHRSLLYTPKEAEKHIEEIIISEIESIIHQNNVGQISNWKVIKNTPIVQGKQYRTVDFISCIRDGAPNNSTIKNKLDSDSKQCFTNQWYGNELKSKKSESDFATLSLLQTEYEKKNIYLTLGVIIQEQRNSAYLLCLQPRCDSTRLESTTEFIFIELQPARSDKFDLILPSGEKFIIAYGRKNRKTILFQVKHDVVSPTKLLYFNDINKKKYKYIATLKKTQAQRVSNEYGAYLSRVGLNESEFLRRNRSKA
jgi:hypothetical protein